MSGRGAGFTLLEILIALVVFGFLLAGLVQGVHFGLRAWDGQAAMIAQREDLDATDTALRNLVEQMDPGFAIDPPGIIGLPEALAFTTYLPLGLAGGDERHADVSLTVDANHRLILRWTPHLHAVRLASNPLIRTEVLLDGVTAVDFMYLDALNGGGRWVRQWDSRTPPSLVRIRIVFEDNGARRDQRDWPDIVIAPMRRQLN